MEGIIRFECFKNLNRHRDRKASVFGLGGYCGRGYARFGLRFSSENGDAGGVTWLVSLAACRHALFVLAIRPGREKRLASLALHRPLDIALDIRALFRIERHRCVERSGWGTRFSLGAVGELYCSLDEGHGSVRSVFYDNRDRRGVALDMEGLPRLRQESSLRSFLWLRVY